MFDGSIKWQKVMTLKAAIAWPKKQLQLYV